MPSTGFAVGKSIVELDLGGAVVGACVCLTGDGAGCVCPAAADDCGGKGWTGWVDVTPVCGVVAVVVVTVVEFGGAAAAS